MKNWTGTGGGGGGGGGRGIGLEQGWWYAALQGHARKCGQAN